GLGPIGYQWYKGTPGSATALSNGGTISGAASNIVVISPAGAADAGSYFVVATNTGGSATSVVATLSIYAPPATAYATNLLSLSPPPVAYWPLNETTQPPATYYATNIGTLGSGFNAIYGTWWAPSNTTFFYQTNSIQHTA